MHPDTKPGDSSQHKKFVELNEAYTTLVNSASRSQYDQKCKNEHVRNVYWHNQKTNGPL